jgi:diguanylate cyclase (GGDEF)-like protein/PAS domain S-box-containing protein
VALQSAAAGAISRFEVPYLDVYGRLLTMDFSLHPVFGQDGRVTCLIPSAHDITEQKQAIRDLRLTQFIIDHAHCAFFVVKPDGRVHYANESACRLLGYRSDQLLGLPIYKFNIRITEAGLPELWSKLKVNGSLQFESIYRRFDASELPVEISVNYIEYEGEEFSFTFVADLSERKAAEKRIHYLAHYDELTGLPNRNLLRDRLVQTIAHADRYREPIWVVSVDLDRVKYISDTLGQESGDMLLKTVAERMQWTVRDIDTLARISGDKFVLILADNFDENLGVGVFQRILNVVAQPLAVKGNELVLSCSIGVAVYPTDGEDAETLLKHADIAGHRAKEIGRNNFQFYTSAMNDRALERLRLEGDLRDAVEREEFVLHYQPQVDLRTGHIIGMEALIRWEHPELGMVPPAKFIGLAEETGLIVPIGKWVIRTACAQNKAWQQAGLGNLRMAVNLSAIQFGQHDFVQSIAAVLEETGLEPQHLEIELTESLVMTEVEHAIEILRALKALGVQLSIDDFGTGYSSLSYLKRFPIDVLKIDQSFVRDMMDHPEDAAIVASIISLAHSLKLHVVAEGVETADQLSSLQRQGCDAMQGYFFSRPVAARAFETLLRDGTCLPNLT